MLTSLSPLDGRYQAAAEPLSVFFSEFSLIKYRFFIEVEYLIAFLDEIGAPVSGAGQEKLRKAALDLSVADGERVKEIEKTTNHDVKSVEYLLREKLDSLKLGKLKQWTHFALTSEDINNLAYGLMLHNSLEQVILPGMERVVQTVRELASSNQGTVMLARTHGQSASPTTFGKEMAVFVHRLDRHRELVAQVKIQGKLAGATGNYNAHTVAFPVVNWPRFAEKFVRSLGLVHNPLTTQIENHDSWAELFHAVIRFNTVLIGFDQDMWRYISDGYVVQQPKKGEVGSSTMPHKVNPIQFENSEGNLQLANAGLGFMAEKFLVSRLQRDLTDSTVERSIGSFLGYSLLGYESCLKGLAKVHANTRLMAEDVGRHPEVLAEAVQTILRREGIEDAYEQLKALTRGEGITLEQLRSWTSGLKVSKAVKAELSALTPEGYIGLAQKMVKGSTAR
ncbi:adenylosuccinate lyase [Candidatus Wirthbacteria bacterium CG2_30_54_11]|uniref:Adenylosuccinate lyase n=1 Tax=Candidatus Wirthbacteria bacterium CG2_30_54_11 TaxID=1817892 RepID=A0A1J5IW10_9BACT|nr:MAG: adenylosuccinate lyase [Candidatus Wirthbacteria bacterium CG2_30_54_11]